MQNAIVDNITVLGIEQKVSQGGYAYAMVNISITQTNFKGTDVAHTSIMIGKPEIVAALQVGGVYSMEFAVKVGKPASNGSRYMNSDFVSCTQTGGAQTQAFAPQQQQQPMQQQPMQQQPAQQQQPMQQQPAPQAAAPNTYNKFDEDIPF